MLAMRTLVVLIVLAIASPARADVGVGFFLGEPTGLDLKFGIGRRSAIDILGGYYSHWNDNGHIDDGAYVHVTYLVTPLIGRGRKVLVPLRLGIGGAVFDDAGRFDDHLHVAVRVPLEVAFVFRSVPLELYGEVAIKATFVDPDDTHRWIDLDGGIGLRFYF
jgi:hypothetical protein